VKQATARRLWAITSYYNPAGYESRLANYRLFRERLAAPLVAVEWARNGRFDLKDGDAEILVQLPVGDIMWQKERLLNRALDVLPDGCDLVAWLDCDVIFEDASWIDLACEALEDSILVHLFHERHNLPRNADDRDVGRWHDPRSAVSIMANNACCASVREDLASAAARAARRTTAGLAWASRREVLDRHKFYDACILGSGDRAMLAAALGKFDSGARALCMNAARRAHYLRWAEPFFNSVRGQVAHLAGRLFHLWHGDLDDRRYVERHEAREMVDFDPDADIAFDHNGCWRWNSRKLDLHAYVRNYFAVRLEDGDDRPTDARDASTSAEPARQGQSMSKRAAAACDAERLPRGDV